MDEHPVDTTRERAALPLAHAAAWFGITTDALRMRIRRGRADGFKRDGRVYVYLSGVGDDETVAAQREDAAGLASAAHTPRVSASDRGGQRWPANGLGRMRPRDYQEQEIERLEADNERLNKRLDRQIEELSEYREMLEREQVLRQQEQRLREQLQQILERLTEQRGLPSPDGPAAPSQLLEPGRAAAGAPVAYSDPDAGAESGSAEVGRLEPLIGDPAEIGSDAAEAEDATAPPAPERESIFAQRVILRAAERADTPGAGWDDDLSDAAAQEAPGDEVGSAQLSGAPAGGGSSAVELAGEMGRSDPAPEGPAAEDPSEAETPADAEVASQEPRPLQDGGDRDGPAVHAAAAPPEPMEPTADAPPPADAAAPQTEAGEAADLAEMLREIGASLRESKSEDGSVPGEESGAGPDGVIAVPSVATSQGGPFDAADGLLDTERRNAARIMRRLLRGRQPNRPRGL